MINLLIIKGCASAYHDFQQVDPNGGYKLIKVFDLQIEQQFCRYGFIKVSENEQPIFLLRLLNNNLVNKIFFQITMQIIY